MGYSGKIIPIPCNKGGFQYPQSLDLLSDFGMVEAKNINLHEGGRQKRGGTTRRLASAVSGTPQITGLYLFSRSNGNQDIIIGTSDGKIWDGDDVTTTAITTGLATGQFFSFETFNDICYICNTANQVQKYTGTGTTTALTTVPTDWGTTSPRQLIKHGRGNSERLWAIGVTGHTRTIYVSVDGSDDFSNTNVTTITINTPDKGGLMGGVVFGDRLIVFSKRHAYIIDDTDVNTANWGYEEAQWLGGVASWRLIIRVPNDILCVTDDGDVYSVSAVQQYGDYKAASLARPAFIDRWIRENTVLTSLDTKFHGVYDEEIRAVKIFVVRSGTTTVDTALVYFIDRAPEEAWVIHDSSATSAGYRASAACQGIKSDGTKKTLTGDYAGWIWYLEDTSTYSDSGSGYYSGFKLPPITFDSMKVDKRFDWLTIVTKPEGTFNLSIKTEVDEAYRDLDLLSLAGVGSLYGTGAFGTATYGSTRILQGTVRTAAIGKRLSYEIFNNTAGQDFFISQLLIAYKTMGVTTGRD